MAELRTEIERIVREVLTQLVSSTGGSASACPAAAKPAAAGFSAAKPAPAATSAAPARSTDLTLTGRVVTMADLDGRLGSIGGGADEVMLGILAKIMGIAKRPPHN